MQPRKHARPHLFSDFLTEYCHSEEGGLKRVLQKVYHNSAVSSTLARVVGGGWVPTAEVFYRLSKHLRWDDRYMREALDALWGPSNFHPTRKGDPQVWAIEVLREMYRYGLASVELSRQCGLHTSRLALILRGDGEKEDAEHVLSWIYKRYKGLDLCLSLAHTPTGHHTPLFLLSTSDSEQLQGVHKMTEEGVVSSLTSLVEGRYGAGGARVLCGVVETMACEVPEDVSIDFNYILLPQLLEGSGWGECGEAVHLSPVYPVEVEDLPDLPLDKLEWVRTFVGRSLLQSRRLMMCALHRESQAMTQTLHRLFSATPVTPEEGDKGEATQESSGRNIKDVTRHLLELLDAHEAEHGVTSLPLPILVECQDVIQSILSD